MFCSECPAALGPACGLPLQRVIINVITLTVNDLLDTQRETDGSDTHVPVAGRWSNARGSGWDSGNGITCRRGGPRALQLSQHSTGNSAAANRKQHGAYHEESERSAWNVPSISHLFIHLRFIQNEPKVWKKDNRQGFSNIHNVQSQVWLTAGLFLQVFIVQQWDDSIICRCIRCPKSFFFLHEIILHVIILIMCYSLLWIAICYSP